jgi:hypothetical protein
VSWPEDWGRAGFWNVVILKIRQKTKYIKKRAREREIVSVILKTSVIIFIYWNTVKKLQLDLNSTFFTLVTMGQYLINGKCMAQTESLIPKLQIKTIQTISSHVNM